MAVKGQSMSEEQKRKISVALKAYNADGGHLKDHRRGGPDHPQWKGGIRNDYYRKIAFEKHGRDCNRCGAAGVDVHHIDRNRRNSDPSNLEVLCVSCHRKEHSGKPLVPWSCPHCGAVKEFQPAVARSRKFCTNECRMKNARTHGGTFVSLRESLRG